MIASSLRGRIARGVLSLVTNNPIGNGFKDGSLKKNHNEKPRSFPDYIDNEIVALTNCRAELLTNNALPPVGGRYVFHVHGGGFIYPTKNTNRMFAGLLSEVGRARVFTPDYRVAPEYVYPAALSDIMDGFDHLISEGVDEDDIIVFGDSAGGTLALSMLHLLKDRGRRLPKKLILMSPMTDMTHSGESYVANYKRDPLFGNTRKSMLYNTQYAGDADVTDKYLSPCFGDFHGFPKTLIQVANYEMLYSDAVSLYEMMKESGVEVSLSVYDKMFHEFQQLPVKMFPESRYAWREVGYFISRNGKDQG